MQKETKEYGLTTLKKEDVVSINILSFLKNEEKIIIKNTDFLNKEYKRIFVDYDFSHLEKVNYEVNYRGLNKSKDIKFYISADEEEYCIVLDDLQTKEIYFIPIYKF